MLRRSKGLVRKTPLRAKAQPKKARKPVKAVSDARRKLGPWMLSCRSGAVEQAKGRCRGGCGRAGTEWHHLFGRTLGVRGGAKWAHIPELTVMLCFQCHQERWPLDHNFRGVLRRYALAALVMRYAPTTNIAADEDAETWDKAAPAAVRVIVASLVRKGVEPSCSG